MLLHPINPSQLTHQPKQRLVHRVRLCLRSFTLLLLILGGPFFVLDGDFEIDDFFGKGRHVVGETEGVFADFIGREDIVALAFFFEREHLLLVGVANIDVNIE